MSEAQILANIERENLHIAPLHLRIFAWFLDGFAMFFVFMLFYMKDFKNMNTLSYNELRNLMLNFVLQIWLCKIIYDVLCVWLFSASFGKMLCKMRVISIDLLDRPSFIRCIFRAISKYVGEVMFGITYIFGFNSLLVRTLHDKCAKTMVIVH